MTHLNFKINDPDIDKWLESKKNKSAVCKEALTTLYKKELQEQYKKQNVKPKVSIIA